MLLSVCLTVFQFKDIFLDPINERESEYKMTNIYILSHLPALNELFPIYL